MSNPAKIHSNLAELLSRQPATARAQVPIPIIVGYRNQAPAGTPSVEGILAARYTYRILPAIALTVTRSAIDTLSDSNDVEMIWYDAPVHTMLDASVPLINAPKVWQSGFTGKGIKVGIVDTGIDPNHLDLANRIAASQNFTVENTIQDNNGHGTHVAGIIGGTGAASGGRYRGVAPDCLFYIAKVLDSSGRGSESDVIAGVDWAVQQGVQVMNLSLGLDGSCDGTDAMSVACDAAVARGVVMCIAAGNAGPGAYTVGSPGCAKNVLTIGATDKSDQIATFSSRGPTADNRIKPDVCFPGVSIISCRASGTSLGTPVGADYTTLSGTSMATPHAAGTSALLLQAKPSSTPQQIKDQIMNSAKNLGLDANTQGNGRGDAFAAFKLGYLSITNVTFTPTSLAGGQLLNVSISVRNDGTDSLPTQSPDPGFIYEEGDTFISRGFPDTAGNYRVTVDYDGRSGPDHPYRWGLGTPLGPGETRTITGAIRLKTIQTRNYWAGFVQEQTLWIQDRQGVQVITVNPPIHIVNVIFAPSSVTAGQLLSVSITVRNDGPTTLQTQGPDPGLTYEEDDTFQSRGFVDVAGSYRVGVDFDGRAGIDHPYRWGLGTPLAPGETRTITGSIRLKSLMTRNFWAGLVQEQIAWLQDLLGLQSISVVTAPPGPQIVSVTMSPTTLDAGHFVDVAITVRNDGDSPLNTQGPDPGFIYEEGDTFETRGFAAVAGNVRLGIDFDGRTGIDHPYRWGLGTPLAPGATRTITGAIKLKTPQAQNYWTGLVREYVAWMEDRQGVQFINVKPGVMITAVTFSPSVVAVGQLLNVSVTVQNGTGLTLPTQGPDPGFVYDEGDSFLSRGYPDADGNYRVGIDFDNRVGIDHPFRWGLGTPLGPGETRTITGSIRMKNPQVQKYWAGLVQEHIAWLQDQEGTSVITVS